MVLDVESGSGRVCGLIREDVTVCLRHTDLVILQASAFHSISASPYCKALSSIAPNIDKAGRLHTGIRLQQTTKSLKAAQHYATSATQQSV